MSYVEFLVTYSGRFLDGTLITLAQFGLAVLVATVAALISGLMKLARSRAVRTLATAYIELFRGTSLLVQLYWFYFVLPLFGFTMEKFTAGFVTVGLCYGAYGAELVRGAIQAVPRGQWEAALALNMSPTQRMRRIILPQALVTILPPWGNLMVEILKGTALVALISVADLMFETRQINNNTYLSAQAFGTALVIYYLFARFMVTPVMRWLERVMARKIGRT
ncbi:ectoine/hydroxyectoine ABC transporter permease subunit EhuC [Marinobacter sp. X15-166B]|uniref:ectoine/hydroxyectoine ABC transporter permease subunit EhuC n=1 Tax=Marinobacter sp. X15-166B TaxID=1897620 RepID=UPI00085CA5FC|nr:ectoine/hydroxyectoine ABC transporter permease subunit EhuC [Marinobacter sp. X15-166B]OEY66252.1 ectoine/hydroxyectoine ABC transporter permease subunit EhuC [Marinobacter sp. X15-166B]